MRATDAHLKALQRRNNHLMAMYEEEKEALKQERQRRLLAEYHLQKMQQLEDDRRMYAFEFTITIQEWLITMIIVWWRLNDDFVGRGKVCGKRMNRCEMENGCSGIIFCAIIYVKQRNDEGILTRFNFDGAFLIYFKWSSCSTWWRNLGRDLVRGNTRGTWLPPVMRI